MLKTQSTNPLAALDKLQQSRSHKVPAMESSSSSQMTLPFWPEAVRGIPNAVLRGALFGVAQRRETVKEELLCSVSGVEIYFTGERFNQTDLDLFEMLLHLGRLQPLGERIEFTAYSMLKALGRHTGKTQRRQLRQELVRLRAGTMEFRWTKTGKGFIGGMLANIAFDDKANQIGRYAVWFDKQVMTLYDHGYTRIDWESRQALGANNLAKWLHSFYATHAAPLPYKVSTIMGLCDSKASRVVDFRRLLRAALDELEAIGALKGYIDENDLVIIEKVPTPSQNRHLRRLK